MAEEYSYPLLKVDEILPCLTELGINVTKDDLNNPTPFVVTNIFNKLIEMLLNQTTEDAKQPEFKDLDKFEDPGMHDESVGTISFVHGCEKLMATSGVVDFSLRDLIIEPKHGFISEPKRLKRFISAAINFAKYREEKLGFATEITERADALAAQKEEAEYEWRRVMTDLSAAQAVRNQEAPEAERLADINKEMVTTVNALYEKQNAVHAQMTATKEEADRWKDEQRETKLQVIDAKEEVEKLRSNIVTPAEAERLQQDQLALQQAHAHEKENLRQAEQNCCESSVQLEAVERAEREMEAVERAQQDCEAEAHKLLGLQDGLKDAKEREHRDDAAKAEQKQKADMNKKREQREQERVAKLQRDHQKKLKDADGRIEEYRQQLRSLGSARSQDAERTVENNREIRELKEKLASARMKHDEDTLRVKQLQQQLAAQVQAYHQELLKAMRQVSATQAQQAHAQSA